MLVDTARSKFREYNPSGAIKLIMDCLGGCSKEQAFKIITGEYRLIAVEDGADFVEDSPDFDIQEWAEDCIVYLEERGRELGADLEKALKDIVYNDKVLKVEVNYSSVINYFINNDIDDLIEDLTENSDSFFAIHSICKEAKSFLESCHDIFISLSYLKNNFDVETRPDAIISLSSEINSFLQELSNDSSSVLNHAFAKKKYMDSQLNKYLECSKTLKEFSAEKPIHPIDITSDADAGWLSPDGLYFGLKGATANFLHIQIADLLKVTRRIDPGDTPADAWMARNGWVKIHHDEIYYDGYLQSRIWIPNGFLSLRIQRLRLPSMAKLYTEVFLNSECPRGNVVFPNFSRWMNLQYEKNYLTYEREHLWRNSLKSICSFGTVKQCHFG